MSSASADKPTERRMSKHPEAKEDGSLNLAILGYEDAGADESCNPTPSEVGVRTGVGVGVDVEFGIGTDVEVVDGVEVGIGVEVVVRVKTELVFGAAASDDRERMSASRHHLSTTTWSMLASAVLTTALALSSGQDLCSRWRFRLDSCRCVDDTFDDDEVDDERDESVDDDRDERVDLDDDPDEDEEDEVDDEGDETVSLPLSRDDGARVVAGAKVVVDVVVVVAVATIAASLLASISFSLLFSFLSRRKRRGLLTLVPD